MDSPAVIGVRTSVRVRVLMILPEEVLWGALPLEQLERRIETPRRAGFVRRAGIGRIFSRAAVTGLALATTVGVGFIVFSTVAPSSGQFVLPNVRAMFLENVTPQIGRSRHLTIPVPDSSTGSIPIPFTPSSSSGSRIRIPRTASGRIRVPIVSHSGTLAPPLPRADNKVGVFLTGNSVGRSAFLSDTMDSLLAASGSALIFDVKGGAVLYHSAAAMATEQDLVVPLFDLPAVLKIAHERGIYTIGRFVAIKDGGLTRALPETAVRSPKTNRVLSADWIDPADPTAIRYNMEIMCELSKSGIDEINMDYIRFSTAQVGALGVYSGKEKADHVETFIRAARETVNRCGPRTRLGISTYAILGWRYDENVETLGQDVVRFAPLVDIISPMAYPATFAANAYYNPGKDPVSRMYYLVYRTLTGYAALLGPEESKKLRPWIQGYGVTAKNMQDQMQGVYDAGACGFTVWNANNAYDVTYRAMKIMSTKRPNRCI